jgi:hypothetical protein
LDLANQPTDDPLQALVTRLIADWTPMRKIDAHNNAQPLGHARGVRSLAANEEDES